MADRGDLVLLERSGPVATLTLDRPEKKISLRDRLSDALDELAGDKRIRVAVITGSGDVFSAGFDLGEFEKARDVAFAKRLWDSSDRFHKRVLTFPLPLIAADNGPL